MTVNTIYKLRKNQKDQFLRRRFSIAWTELVKWQGFWIYFFFVWWNIAFSSLKWGSGVNLSGSERIANWWVLRHSGSKSTGRQTFSPRKGTEIVLHASVERLQREGYVNMVSSYREIGYLSDGRKQTQPTWANIVPYNYLLNQVF